MADSTSSSSTSSSSNNSSSSSVRDLAWAGKAHWLHLVEVQVSQVWRRHRLVRSGGFNF